MIKKIGNDSLILITPDQGETINRKYITFIDTIKKISFENKNLKYNVDSLNKNIIKINANNNILSNSLNLYKDSLYKKNMDFELYKRKKNSYDLSEKRVTIFGIGIAVFVWITLVVIDTPINSAGISKATSIRAPSG